MPRRIPGLERLSGAAFKQRERERLAELSSLFDLHGEAVYRCASFVAGPDDAETITSAAFRAVWIQTDDLDHRDPAHRMRLITSCIQVITGTAPDPGSMMTERAALAVVVFGHCSYRAAAEALGLPAAYVLDRLGEAMRRDLMGLDHVRTSHNASGVGVNS